MVFTSKSVQGFLNNRLIYYLQGMSMTEEKKREILRSIVDKAIDKNKVVFDRLAEI